MGLSCLTPPTSQEPRTEPSLDLIYRNSGTPRHAPPALGWELGRAEVFGVGQGLDPQERYNTGSERGRCLTIKHR